MHGIYAGNNLSGFIPPQLFHLPLLWYLYLDGNSLNSGEVQLDEEEEIGTSRRVCWNYPSLVNKFSNDMLLLVLCLKELEYLDLSHNDLSMEIPIENENLLPNILSLSLNNNWLIGGIPLSMKILSKLEGLYLHNNLLIKEIPP